MPAACFLRIGLPGLAGRALEAVLIPVFPDLPGGKHLPAHGDIDARLHRLHGSDRHAHVKNGIGAAKTCRTERAGQHDGLVCKPFKRQCCFRHRVRTVGDDVVRCIVLLNELPQLLTIVIGNFEAVFVEQRLDVVVKRHKPFLQNVLDLGLANFETAHRIEINLVDRAAGGYESYEHLRSMPCPDAAQKPAVRSAQPETAMISVMNKQAFRVLLLLLALLPFTARADGPVYEVELDGPLGVATAEYIIDGIEQAAAQNARLIIIRVDTPGGLVEPMRDIVSAILASPVPVATYVSPDGARAASAGTYILLASHVAAMSPTTQLGAATPVSLGGGESPDPPTPLDRGKPPADDNEASDNDGESPESEEPVKREGSTAMERKVLNDAISYIRGLAEAHGRNADWAEQAVRDAATLTAREALEQNVIDLIATDRAALLEQIHGRTVTAANREVVLDTRGAAVETIEPTWRTRILSTIANPQVALLLMIVGIYGLVFEGWNPGAIVPGVVGVVCLLLAAYALQVIPVNYAGLALILLGMALIVAEAFAPSFGALGLGGITAFVFGAIMMFDSGIPGFGISLSFVIALALVSGGLLLWLVTYLLKLQSRGAVSGQQSILNGIAVAMESFQGEGRVWLEGEAWQASSTVAVTKDQELKVRSIDGLRLEVEPLDPKSS